MQPGPSTLSSSTTSSDTRILTLTTTLNALIAALGIPITIEAPYELTPSLLLALLESITRRRLPVPQAVRRARDAQSRVQAMKIFLGVLESDMLQEDVGLSKIDPRRLAVGEWKEVMFVGELLCWLGKIHGFISDVHVVHPTLENSVSDFSTEAEWKGLENHVASTLTRCSASIDPPNGANLTFLSLLNEAQTVRIFREHLLICPSGGRSCGRRHPVTIRTGSVRRALAYRRIQDLNSTDPRGSDF